MTNSKRPALYVILVLSFVLGAAAAWPAEGWPRIAYSGLAIGFFFISLCLFFLILPRYVSLPVQILIAMVVGVAVGLACWMITWVFRVDWPEAFVTGYLGIFGSIFFLLLKMVVVPLVFASLTCGVANIGDVRRLGPMGGKTIAYFLLATSIATLIGLGFVNLIQPGVGREELRASAQELAPDSKDQTTSPGTKFQEDILPSFIQNPIMADAPILAIILFALLLGAALAASGEEGAPAVKVLQAIDKAMVTLVLWVMLLAPIGVFALMTKVVATLGALSIYMLGKYCLTVILGLIVHFLVLVFVLLPLLGRFSPWQFLKGVAPALELAFATSSSSATLPVTLDCTQRRLGVSPSVTNFVIPLGTTVNMDGTALYQAVAALFIAQVYGVHLGLQEQFMVFFTAIIVSIGTAGIPGASIALMSIVLASAGIPVEGIGIIIGVDRFLDMSRTVVNVVGDSIASVIVARSEGYPLQPQPKPSRASNTP
ncbi:MAG: dicarboxylate/amino acid:cation symporter [Candidatus Hydrogenedentes bacterium]|nr:dicarboxylate/amino acid:cation symporter [Candidatus Hydrogenedentota bacterium]